MHDLAARYLDALRRGDRLTAYQTVDKALDTGSDLRTLYLSVLQPSMHEIGRLWQQNQMSVAEEHLATSITQSAMVRLFERVYKWQPNESSAPKLVAACVEYERHQIGLSMLCDLLDLEGWETVYLGASVPIESLVSFIQTHQPDVVALSATIAPHFVRLQEAVQTIRSAPLERQPLIVVGGRAVATDPSMARQTGADCTAADADEAVALLQQHLPSRKR